MSAPQPQSSSRNRLYSRGGHPLGNLLTRAARPTQPAAAPRARPPAPTADIVPREENAEPEPVDQARLEQWRRVRKNSSPFDAGMFLPMLAPAPRAKQGKILLILDIDETLVHASLKQRDGLKYDATVRVDVGSGQQGEIFVAFRPHLQTFLTAIAPLFEVVVFTASQSCYANSLMDIIDPTKATVTERLFREHCTEANGARVKDLSLLGRSLDRMAIIDNSPVAYLFQPRNAIPIESWFENPDDRELLKLLPMLRELANAKSVYDVLDPFNCRLNVQ